MSVWSTIWSKVRQFGPLIGTMVGRAIQAGFSDELLRTALVWVRVAAKKEIDNDARRAWVVQILVDKGVKESIARFAVEAAYQLYKAELEKQTSAGVSADNIVWGT